MSFKGQLKNMHSDNLFNYFDLCVVKEHHRVIAQNGNEYFVKSVDNDIVNCILYGSSKTYEYKIKLANIIGIKNKKTIWNPPYVMKDEDISYNYFGVTNLCPLLSLSIKELYERDDQIDEQNKIISSQLISLLHEKEENRKLIRQLQEQVKFQALEHIKLMKMLNEKIRGDTEYNKELTKKYNELLVSSEKITEYMKRINKMEEYMPYKIEEKQLLINQEKQKKREERNLYAIQSTDL